MASSLIKFRHEIFNPVPSKVLWFYSERVSIPSSVENLIDECYGDYESYEFLRSRVHEHRDNGGCICFIDDSLGNKKLMNDLDKIFYELSHHGNCTFLVASQELFYQNKHYRTMSKNAGHLWCFKVRIFAFFLFFIFIKMDQ